MTMPIQGAQPSKSPKLPKPANRRLRAFAFDPCLSQRIDMHDINEITISLPWEKHLKQGPVDDYLEVVDYDPASQAFYAPVNLNDPDLLAQDGLPPMLSNPQFHQQMVYGVVRTTIRHFEKALGRRALWSPRKNDQGEYEYVDHLRVYPHALREANAYYSPEKKALLFGYFPASTTSPGMNLPGGIVFTCLSHDIVAHETTHALIDGLHRRFIEPSNVDVWALHEALADLVALFQHFTYPEVLRGQIAQTRGDLESQNLLGELAFQFGQAIGNYGALRSAIWKIDPETKKPVPVEPDPKALRQTTEPHARGAILVAAVFDAFLTVYKRRIADLLRIASGGTGILAPGALHPDLVERLAQEAAKTAGHFLQICIRALDYCPPVDVDFGDYLRAMITADADLLTEDRLNYRLAIIEAFRRRGIYPNDVRNLSEEGLLWIEPSKEDQKVFQRVFTKKILRQLALDWGMTTNRERIYRKACDSQERLHNRIAAVPEVAKAFHLKLDAVEKQSLFCNDRGVPFFEVHSVRPARRVGPDGDSITDLVVEITQRRRGYIDPDRQQMVDAGDTFDPDFIFRGGCTLLVDLHEGKVRYCIYKDIDSKYRLERMRKYLGGDESPSLRSTYFGDPRQSYYTALTGGEDEAMGTEPFAMINRSFTLKEVK